MTHPAAGLALVVIVLLTLAGAAIEAALPMFYPADPGVYMPGPDTGPFANW